MNTGFAELAKRIDSLATKERALALCATLLVLIMAWVRFGLEPLEARKQVLDGQIATSQARQAELDAEAVAIVQASQTDPNLPVRNEIGNVVQQTSAFEQEIRERAGQLVAPEEMPRILQSVLQNIQGLAFVSLEGLGAEPLLPPAQPVRGAVTPVETVNTELKNNAYRHGFRIRFTGTYLDTLAYLRALEALPWRFFWDAVELEVTAHPQMRASIVVYTLSLDRRWIGV